MGPSRLVQVATGRLIDPRGVVVVPDWGGVDSGVPNKDAAGIRSWRALVFDDTRGPVTQLKWDSWKPKGYFATHVHGDMDEVFIVLEGTATFEYGLEGEEPETIAVEAGGMIYFPKGVWHAGRNEKVHTTTLLIVGLRNRVPDEADAANGKGKNIPA